MAGDQIGPLDLSDDEKRTLGVTFARAMMGDLYDRLVKAQRIADAIRLDRAAYEDALDQLMTIHQDPDKRLEPQELRAGTTVVGLLAKYPDPEKLWVLFALALERLGTLEAVHYADTRAGSMVQRTPLGTLPGDLPMGIFDDHA